MDCFSSPSSRFGGCGWESPLSVSGPAIPSRTTALSWLPAADVFACITRRSTSAHRSPARPSGVKEVDDGVWLVSFMNYDLGYIDLEEKTLPPLENPFGPKV
jgi:hypothetical protein